MTSDRVIDLINERGLAYLDYYVAREFSDISGQPEEDVIRILHRQESLCLLNESGPGRYKRAKRRACLLLTAGWENGREVSTSAVGLLPRYELATAYAILAGRERNNESQPETNT